MQRRPIKQLPTSLVNRIAAGEVIERPASVVKELVENAIDAGATSITVEIEDGGREVIRVIDNGCGIPPEELLLAFAEHATSKLESDEDLFRIATMGFRGEALASIGAVSHSRILSRTAGNDAAYEILCRGGLVSDPQASAGNVGTTVEVRNLFFNTPARRKFLKGASTESGHISDMLLRLALPHPKIAFKLMSGSRTTMDLPAAGPEERLLAAWPDDFREQRLRIDLADAELRLHGIIGLPETAHATAKYQYFYLNGRHIRDRFVQHALKEAYRGLTEPGRQPAAILRIDMPPGDVDVNVHPTKAEVRFRDSGRIHGLILASLREKLLGSDLAPRATTFASRAAGVSADPPDAAPSPPREDMRQRLAEFLRQGVGDSPSAAVPLPPLPGGAIPPATHQAPGSSASADWSTRPQRASGGYDPQATSRWSPPADVHPAPPPSPPLPAPLPPQVSSPSLLPRMVAAPAIQLHNTYLVTETDDGLMIIDQHALHERIMYEDLLGRISRGPLESQRLLIPDVVNVTTRQLSLLEQIDPLLRKLGIELSAFGPDSVAVQSFPTFLDKLDPGRFVKELLERGEQEMLDLHQEELLHELLDMMACKAAVKAGDPLTGGEIESLLARRDLVDRSSNCPHGRPTSLRLSLRDLEKQFKRTGF